jgi:hypothetical protein
MAQVLDRTAVIGRAKTAALQELDKKFDALDIEPILKPENLVDGNAIARSRATLKTFRGLIDERREVYKSTSEKIEAILRTSNLSRIDLQDAMARLNRSSGRTTKLLTDLDEVQLRTIDAISKILDMCENNLGKFRIQKGDMLFVTQAQLDLYRTQLTLIQDYAKQETAARNPIVTGAQLQQDHVRDEVDPLTGKP